ncbi:hypothetical protein BD408DRAFT_419998 [Parasitella parasitica]|nr:hypothetical protein BD408DRAFT_419998 [Parasitella parasitica]
MFTHDSIKYRTGASTNVKTTTRNNYSYSRPSPMDQFSPTMRGKRSGPTKTIIEAL